MTRHRINGHKAFYYEQGTGTLLLGNGGYLVPFAVGYAGAPGYINSPAHEHIASKGPLPRGEYEMWVHKHPRFAAPAIMLKQGKPETSWHGRSGFWIHGDNAKGDRSASSGCIILGKPVRDAIAALMAVGWNRLIVRDKVPF